jgi:YfiH family protein
MGFSTGDAEGNVLHNRREFLRSLDVSPAAVAVGQLSHGNAVSVFQNSQRSELPQERVTGTAGTKLTELTFRTDAVISSVSGLHFLLTFADCVPLLFLDCGRGVVGAAHAGWRGTALNIAAAVVRRMQTTFGTQPSDILVGVGPAIGPCCYTVGPDVLSSFRLHGSYAVVSKTGCDERISLDLWATNERQLIDCGVPPASIENPRICTSCNVASFFSHRAENGRTGRFAACIGLP